MTQDLPQDQDNAATAKIDYEPTTDRTLSITSGSSGIIPVPIKFDTEVEPDEQFKVLLFNPTNAQIMDDEAFVTIHDTSDLPPPDPGPFPDPPCIEGDPWCTCCGDISDSECQNPCPLTTQ